MGKSPEQIEADIRRPKYFSPSEAVEYGIIDKVPIVRKSKLKFYMGFWVSCRLCLSWLPAGSLQREGK